MVASSPPDCRLNPYSLADGGQQRGEDLPVRRVDHEGQRQQPERDRDDDLGHRSVGGQVLHPRRRGAGRDRVHRDRVHRFGVHRHHVLPFGSCSGGYPARAGGGGVGHHRLLVERGGGRVRCRGQGDRTGTRTTGGGFPGTARTVAEESWGTADTPADAGQDHSAALGASRWFAPQALSSRGTTRPSAGVTVWLGRSVEPPARPRQRSRPDSSNFGSPLDPGQRFAIVSTDTPRRTLIPRTRRSPARPSGRPRPTHRRTGRHASSRSPQYRRTSTRPHTMTRRKCRAREVNDGHDQGHCRTTAAVGLHRRPSTGR